MQKGWRGGLGKQAWLPLRQDDWMKFYKHTYSWAKGDSGSIVDYLHLEIPPLIINLSVTFKHGPVGDEWVLA